MSVRPVQMEFKYGTSFLGDSPEAYERLLHDALLGDATLFTRADEVEAEWRIVQPILDAWESGPGAVDVRGRQPGAAGGRRAARRPRAKLEAGVRRAVPERSRWTRRGRPRRAGRRPSSIACTARSRTSAAGRRSPAR